jgi:hypothetical protein
MEEWFENAQDSRSKMSRYIKGAEYMYEWRHGVHGFGYGVEK